MKPFPAAPLAGFLDPARASGDTFRLVLDAMARPGSRVAIPASGAVSPPGVPASAAATLLTLLDHETPYWACPELATPELRGWIAFHCGAPLVASPVEARFALASGGADGPPLSAYMAGEDRYPDRSATILVVCASLTGGEKAVLSGPGILGERVIAPTGLRASFWDEARQNHDRFPLGVDLILCAGDELLCLPRSTAIEPFGEGG